MGRARNLESYKGEWTDIATMLCETPDSEVTFVLNTKSDAQSLRLRFYNFRVALQRHDPENPWIKPLMGKVAGIKQNAEGKWDLRIGEDEFRNLLASIIKPSVLAAPQAIEVPQGPGQEDVLSGMYAPNKAKGTE